MDVIDKIKEKGPNALRDIISYELAHSEPLHGFPEIIVGEPKKKRAEWVLTGLKKNKGDGKYYFDPQDWKTKTEEVMKALNISGGQRGGEVDTSRWNLNDGLHRGDTNPPVQERSQPSATKQRGGALPENKVSELFHGWLTRVKNTKKTSIQERNIDIAESLSNFFKLFIETHNSDGAYFVFCKTRLICFMEEIGLTSEIQGLKPAVVDPGQGDPAAPPSPYCENPPPGTDDELCNKHCKGTEDNKKCKDGVAGRSMEIGTSEDYAGKYKCLRAVPIFDDIEGKKHVLKQRKLPLLFKKDDVIQREALIESKEYDGVVKLKIRYTDTEGNTKEGWVPLHKKDDPSWIYFEKISDGGKGIYIQKNRNKMKTFKRSNRKKNKRSNKRSNRKKNKRSNRSNKRSNR